MTERAGSRQAAARRDTSDDTIIDLLIEEQRINQEFRFRYVLLADALEIGNEEFASPRLLDRKGTPAATVMAYVDWVYRRVEQRIFNRKDASNVLRDVRATGLQMGEELIDPDFVRLIWPHREKIRSIRLISWEPFIPWELIRLRHPDTQEVDDKYLCEYGLIRQISRQRAVRRLQMREWSYLEAMYPAGSTLTAVTDQTEYFRETLPSRGLRPLRIEPERSAALDAIRACSFDVLHIACHGRAKHGDIDSSELIIGETVLSETRREAITLDPVTVNQEAREGIRQRRPIVFLNACESGRQGASLTTWGGWPTAFLTAGAGVFVGTSWPVRGAPAKAFAAAFYDTLLGGEALVDAANAARAAAKAFSDPSWLAYRVFGHPQARRIDVASGDPMH